MAALAVAAAVVLAIALAVRERTWRRERRDLRARLAAHAAEAGEQERRAHVTQVVSGLAQELKSPLQGVLGNTEVMLASGMLNQESRADLREIQESATRAAGIVRHLLAFAAADALTPRWQDMNEIVERARDAVKTKLATSGISVHLALHDRLPLIYVDGRQLENVLAALLSRSTHFSRTPSARGSITVATRAAASGDRLIVELDDPAADVDEAAWSGDLAACRSIVAAHGGTLEVVRAGNARFRFQLELPVAPAGAEPARI